MARTMTGAMTIAMTRNPPGWRRSVTICRSAGNAWPVATVMSAGCKPGAVLKLDRPLPTPRTAG
jgi:hypothetical protein